MELRIVDSLKERGTQLVLSAAMPVSGTTGPELRQGVSHGVKGLVMITKIEDLGSVYDDYSVHLETVFHCLVEPSD